MARTCAARIFSTSAAMSRALGCGGGRERVEHRPEHRDVVVRGEVAERVVVRDELALRRPARRAGAALAASIAWSSRRSGGRCAGRRRVPAGSTWPSRRAERRRGRAAKSRGRATSAGRPAGSSRRRGGSSGPVEATRHGRRPPACVDQLAHPGVEADARLDDQPRVVQRDGVGGARLVLVRVDVRLEDAGHADARAADVAHEVLQLRGRRDDARAAPAARSAELDRSCRSRRAAERPARRRQRGAHGDPAARRGAGGRAGGQHERRGRSTPRAPRSWRRAARRAGTRAPGPTAASRLPAARRAELQLQDRAGEQARGGRRHDQQARDHEPADGRRARDHGGAEHEQQERVVDAAAVAERGGGVGGEGDGEQAPRRRARQRRCRRRRARAVRARSSLPMPSRLPKSRPSTVAGRVEDVGGEHRAGRERGREQDPGDRAGVELRPRRSSADCAPANAPATPNAPSHGLKPRPAPSTRPGTWTRRPRGSGTRAGAARSSFRAAPRGSRAGAPRPSARCMNASWKGSVSWASIRPGRAGRSRRTRRGARRRGRR